MTLLDADVKASSSLVGEDTWELFEAIESSFGVNLGDYEVLAGIRVGELASRIGAMASYPEENACLSSAAFYRVRRALEAVSSVPARLIRPATKLGSILPWRTRRRDWRKLEDALGLRIPRLMITGLILLLCLVAAPGLLISLRVFLHWHLNAGVIFDGSFVMLIFLMWVSIPFARSINSEWETVGGLAKAVLALNYAAFAVPHGSSRERGIVPGLRFLVAAGASLDIEKITEETRIPNDLNIY